MNLQEARKYAVSQQKSELTGSGPIACEPMGGEPIGGESIGGRPIENGPIGGEPVRGEQIGGGGSHNIYFKRDYQNFPSTFAAASLACPCVHLVHKPNSPPPKETPYI